MFIVPLLLAVPVPDAPSVALTPSLDIPLRDAGPKTLGMALDHPDSGFSNKSYASMLGHGSVTTPRCTGQRAAFTHGAAPSHASI